jgi:hypothetical protein
VAPCDRRPKRSKTSSYSTATSRNGRLLICQQGGMQRRLSARSSGVVESSRSGGRSGRIELCGRYSYRRTTPEEELGVDGFLRVEVLGGKVPYSIGMADNSPFVFASHWEGREDHSKGVWLRTVRSSPANRMSLCERSMPRCRSFCPKSIKTLRGSRYSACPPEASD